MTTLYKKDSKGKLRYWEVKTFGSTYWYEYGLDGGKRTSTKPKQCYPKNLGKVNETTAEQQAELEAAAEAEKKKKEGWIEDRFKAMDQTLLGPMLAQTYKGQTLDFPVYVQSKLDGIRAIVSKQGALSRKNRQHGAAGQMIYELVKPVFDQHPTLVLDGELYNHYLCDEFQTITSLVRKEKPNAEEMERIRKLVQFHFYDAYFTDQTHLPFTRRFDKAIEILAEYKLGDMIQPVPYIQADSESEIEDLHKDDMLCGYEGSMIRTNSPYDFNKRSKFLLKYKKFTTEEFRVEAVEEGDGQWTGAVKAFHCHEESTGIRFKCGVRGPYDVLRDLLLSGQVPDWATVRYFNRTDDHKPRFPVAVDYGTGERDD